MPRDLWAMVIALIGTGYAAFATGLPGSNTLTGQSFDVVRQYVATQQAFFAGCLAVFAVQVLAFAWATCREPALVLTTVVWATFAVLVIQAKPGALLPGYALVMICLNALAFYDARRARHMR